MVKLNLYKPMTKIKQSEQWRESISETSDECLCSTVCNSSELYIFMSRSGVSFGNSCHAIHNYFVSFVFLFYNWQGKCSPVIGPLQHYNTHPLGDVQMLHKQ